MFIPAFYYRINRFITMVQLFRMQDDSFIGIFKQIGQYRPKYMVTVGNIAVEIIMR